MRLPKIKRKMPIPFLEITFAFFSIYAAILFFMSDFHVFENIQRAAAELMLTVMPPFGWGIVFLFNALLITTGLVTNYHAARFVGLFVTVVIFATLTACHTVAFPNLSFGLYGVLTCTGIGALFTVRETEL